MNEKAAKIGTFLTQAWIYGCVGFAIGSFSTPTIKKEEKHLEAHSEKKEVEVTQTHQEAKKYAVEGSTVRVIRKYYCPNGNIKEEVRIDKQNLAVRRDMTNHTANVVESRTDNQETKSITKVEYQSRWGVGVFMPPEYPLKPDKLNLMISYKLIGPFSVAAQSDVLLKTPQVGIILNF